MDFAKAQLLKYGWKEGKGLGKSEDGLTEALKPTLKFDHAGIGYSKTDTEHWWEILYDKTIKNVKVESCEDKTSLSKINDSNTIDDWSTISPKNSKKTEQQTYGNFLKSSILFNGHLIQDTSIEKEGKPAKDSVYIPLTDEQLYKACDGYKTTRHDLLNGKLERIAQQDRMFLNVGINNISQLDTNLVKENTMTHRKTTIEIDTEESEDPEESQEIVGEDTLQHETKDFVIKSKSARKSHKKKINKLTQQFSICSLKKNTDSNLNSQYDEFLKSFFKLAKEEKKSQLNIKSGKCSKKRNKNKRKKSLEQRTHISYNIIKETSIEIEDKLKDIVEDIQLLKSQSSYLEKNNEIMTHVYVSPSSPIKSNSHNLNNKDDKDIHQINLLTSTARKKNIQQWKTGWQYSDVGENNFDPITLLHNKDIKIKRKTHQQKQIKKQLDKIIDAENFCTDDLNNVIKKLTTFDLTEEVNANALKKKLTQTHLTPV